MVASRNRPKGVRKGSFGLSVLVLSLMPAQTGHQDIGALLARTPEVTQRWRAHVMKSPFGIAQAAAFNFPRPLGTTIPEPPVYRLASLDFSDPDITGALPQNLDPQDSQKNFGNVPMPRARPLEFPTVNRRLKGDLLTARPQSEPAPQPGTRDLTPGRVKTVSFPRPDEQPGSAEPELAEQAAPSAQPQAPELASLPPKTEMDRFVAPAIEEAPSPAAVPDQSSAVPDQSPAAPDSAALPTEESLFDPIDDANPAVRLSRLYFGANPVGESVGGIQPWPSHEELVLVAPGADPDIKRSALEPLPDSAPDDAKSSSGPSSSKPSASGPYSSAPSASTPASGETIAPKGEVTGAGKRPKTPAERLGLEGKGRAKAEKCLDRGGLFRVARRGQARPGRGRAGGDEPRVLGLLSERRLRRGLPERASSQRLPVHLRLRQRPRRGEGAASCGCRRRRSRATRSTASCGSKTSASRRTTTPIGCIRGGSAPCASCRASACTRSTGRGAGATARKRRPGARASRRKTRRCTAALCSGPPVKRYATRPHLRGARAKRGVSKDEAASASRRALRALLSMRPGGSALARRMPHVRAGRS